jgi:ATP-dependent DNA ligase
LQLPRRWQPPYPWPPEQAQPGVSKPYRTTLPTYSRCCGVPLSGPHGALRRPVSSSPVSLSSSIGPPAGSDWLHEIKHDGYRIIARREGGRVTLWSRHGTNFTDRLPKVAEAVCSLAADSALIDGEAVTFRSDGHSDFAALRTKAGSAQARLVAFDLLSLNGEDLRRAFAGRPRRRQHPVQ